MSSLGKTSLSSFSKVTTLLVNETVIFKRIIDKRIKHSIFCQNNARNSCSAKVPYNFSAKTITAVDFVSTVRLNKSSTNNFIKLMMLCVSPK